MELFSHVIIERDFPDESISNTSQMLSPINLKTIIRVLLHQPNLQAVLIQVFITKIIPRFGRKTPQATLPPPLPALRPSVRVQRVVMVSTRDQRIYKRDWWWTVAVRKGILLNFETNMQTRGKPHAVGSHGKRARTTIALGSGLFIIAPVDGRVQAALPLAHLQWPNGLDRLGRFGTIDKFRKLLQILDQKVRMESDALEILLKLLWRGTVDDSTNLGRAGCIRSMLAQVAFEEADNAMRLVINLHADPNGIQILHGLGDGFVNDCLTLGSDSLLDGIAINIELLPRGTASNLSEGRWVTKVDSARDVSSDRIRAVPPAWEVAPLRIYNVWALEDHKCQLHGVVSDRVCETGPKGPPIFRAVVHPGPVDGDTVATPKLDALLFWEYHIAAAAFHLTLDALVAAGDDDSSDQVEVSTRIHKGVLQEIEVALMGRVKGSWIEQDVVHASGSKKGGISSGTIIEWSIREV
ncbi:hypothetical protein HG531_013779 [Fusarium graminearum]|nr:hypothetical protein HG531_013779 [Fusarium graminearum]